MRGPNICGEVIDPKRQKDPERTVKNKRTRKLTFFEEPSSFLAEHKAEEEEHDANDDQNRDRGYEGNLEVNSQT